tara:strand:- start:212 stop:424 length:213 start_codon:yes stop_codon:yes gene_type:complete
MERNPVTSSMIASIGFQDCTLEVEFSDRSIYQYDNVPEYIYTNMMNAESKGTFFWDNIRRNNNYNYKKIF